MPSSIDGCINTLVSTIIIGVRMSEPHTSELSGMSVTFTKIYEVIRINGRVCKCLHLKTDYLQMLPAITQKITLVYRRSI